MDYDRRIFASLTLRLCERQKPVRRILRISTSRVAFSTSVWLISPSLTMKPPFVPILVITIVMSLMRKLRLTGDDIIYSAYRQKFDFSPCFRHCIDTLVPSFQFHFVASLLSHIFVLRERKLREIPYVLQLRYLYQTRSIIFFYKTDWFISRNCL